MATSNNSKYQEAKQLPSPEKYEPNPTPTLRDLHEAIKHNPENFEELNVLCIEEYVNETESNNGFFILGGKYRDSPSLLDLEKSLTEEPYLYEGLDKSSVSEYISHSRQSWSKGKFWLGGHRHTLTSTSLTEDLFKITDQEIDNRYLMYGGPSNSMKAYSIVKHDAKYNGIKALVKRFRFLTIHHTTPISKELIDELDTKFVNQVTNRKYEEFKAILDAYMLSILREYYAPGGDGAKAAFAHFTSKMG